MVQGSCNAGREEAKREKLGQPLLRALQQCSYRHAPTMSQLLVKHHLADRVSDGSAASVTSECEVGRGVTILSVLDRNYITRNDIAIHQPCTTLPLVINCSKHNGRFVISTQATTFISKKVAHFPLFAHFFHHHRCLLIPPRQVERGVAEVILRMAVAKKETVRLERPLPSSQLAEVRGCCALCFHHSGGGKGREEGMKRVGVGRRRRDRGGGKGLSRQGGEKKVGSKYGGWRGIEKRERTKNPLVVSSYNLKFWLFCKLAIAKKENSHFGWRLNSGEIAPPQHVNYPKHVIFARLYVYTVEKRAGRQAAAKGRTHHLSVSPFCSCFSSSADYQTARPHRARSNQPVSGEVVRYFYQKLGCVQVYLPPPSLQHPSFRPSSSVPPFHLFHSLPFLPFSFPLFPPSLSTFLRIEGSGGDIDS
mmetsp:Transcript_11697/g.31497  ORF Transcript_11697/g.31497 Transcript_11697/m.31497 type:complete len:420 (+) Transcript_11697:1292-2551(+)